MSRSIRKQMERNAVDWLKAQYRAKATYQTTMDLREALLPVVALPREQFSVGEASRIDRMARNEVAREPNPPAVTPPVKALRFLRSADATPDIRLKTVKRRASDLTTRAENLAAIAVSHSVQPDALLGEKEAAMRLRVVSDVARSVASIEEGI